MALEQPTSPHPVAPTADAVPSFVQSLHTMLQVEDASIIRWTPDGQAFEILDQRMLANRILHRYFRHTKYASFQRQLNYFGFRKWPKQKAAICTYSQLYFSRDNPADLHRIKRRVKASLLDAGQVNATPLVDCSVEVSDASFLPAASHGFLTSAEDLDSLVTTLNTVRDTSCPESQLPASPRSPAIQIHAECHVKEEAETPQTVEPKCESPRSSAEPMSWHHAMWASDWLCDIDPHDVELVLSDPYLWSGSV